MVKKILIGLAIMAIGIIGDQTTHEGYFLWLILVGFLVIIGPDGVKKVFEAIFRGW